MLNHYVDAKVGIVLAENQILRLLNLIIKYLLLKLSITSSLSNLKSLLRIISNIFKVPRYTKKIPSSLKFTVFIKYLWGVNSTNV